MLPSGSSLFHPHLQGSVDPVPTTMQRLLADAPADRFRAYLDAERDGRRALSRLDRAGALARELRAAGARRAARVRVRRRVAGASSTTISSRNSATGSRQRLNLYAELGFESFNLALYGAPAAAPTGYPLNLRMACRSNLKRAVSLRRHLLRAPALGGSGRHLTRKSSPSRRATASAARARQPRSAWAARSISAGASREDGRGGSSGSSARPGITCRWKCMITCPAASPHEFQRWTRSQPRLLAHPLGDALGGRVDVRRDPLASISTRSLAWRRGTTSACPGRHGLTSMNATV